MHIVIYIFQANGSLIWTYTDHLNRLCTHHGVGVGSPVQVVAALSISVGTNAETVRWVELLHEEGTAGLNHRRQLQQAGG